MRKEEKREGERENGGRDREKERNGRSELNMPSFIRFLWPIHCQVNDETKLSNRKKRKGQLQSWREERIKHSKENWGEDSIVDFLHHRFTFQDLGSHHCWFSGGFGGFEGGRKKSGPKAPNGKRGSSCLKRRGEGDLGACKVGDFGGEPSWPPKAAEENQQWVCFLGSLGDHSGWVRVIMITLNKLWPKSLLRRTIHWI